MLNIGATQFFLMISMLLILNLICLSQVAIGLADEADEDVSYQTESPASDPRAGSDTRNDDGEEEFMLLNEDDVVQQNANVLQYLENASKEEVEEILEQNPELQKKLLSRVRKVVRTKKQKQPIPPVAPYQAPPNYGTFLSNQPPPIIHPHPQPHPPIPQPPPVVGPKVPPTYDDYEYEYYDDYDDSGIDKTALMQAKIKDKAIKWYRIGKGLKAKLGALRFSKHKDLKPEYSKPGVTHTHKDYHFHFDVSKSSDHVS